MGYCLKRHKHSTWQKVIISKNIRFYNVPAEPCLLLGSTALLKLRLIGLVLIIKPHNVSRQVAHNITPTSSCCPPPGWSVWYSAWPSGGTPGSCSWPSSGWVPPPRCGTCRCGSQWLSWCRRPTQSCREGGWVAPPPPSLAQYWPSVSGGSCTYQLAVAGQSFLVRGHYCNTELLWLLFGMDSLFLSSLLNGLRSGSDEYDTRLVTPGES